MSWSLCQKHYKEWQKLDSNTKEQFKRKLAQRLENPKVPKDKLRDFDNVYKDLEYF